MDSSDRDPLSSSENIFKKARLVRHLRHLLGNDEAVAKSNLIRFDIVREQEEPNLAVMELKLREALELKTPWDKLKPLVWDYYQSTVREQKQSHVEEAAVRVLEMAVLAGGNDQQITQVLKLVNPVLGKAYPRIHPLVRERYLIQLWNSPHRLEWVNLILWIRDDPNLLAGERLCILLLLLKKNDLQPGTIEYFLRYQEQIFLGLESYQQIVKIKSDELWLLLAQKSFSENYLQDAHSFCSQIGRNSHCSELADELLDRINLAVVDCPLGRRFYHAEHWRQKLAVLSELLSLLQQDSLEVGDRAKYRGLARYILHQPNKWLPLIADAYGAFSTLICSYQSLQTILENIDGFFIQQRFEFTRSDLCLALWRPLLDTSVLGSELADLQGFAYLQIFVHQQEYCEQSLWKAKELVIKNKNAHVWQESIESACTAILTNGGGNYENRQLKILLLKISGTLEKVSTDDIKEYLKSISPKTPPLDTIDVLLRSAVNRGDLNLVLELVRCRGKKTHLRNDDISTIWQCAVQLEKPDLAWRSLSLAVFRNALAENYQVAWQVSGEKRSKYPLISLKPNDIDEILAEFNGKEARLLWILCQIGPMISELISMVDSKVVPFKPIENSEWKFVQNQEWLKSGEKTYVFSPYGKFSEDHIIVPAIASFIPNSSWGQIFSGFSTYLGVESFQWKVSRLRQILLEINEKLKNIRDSKKFSMLLAKWVKKLNAEEKSCWYDLSSICQNLTDQEAQDCIGKFILRISVASCHDHIAALSCVEKMRLPTSLLWDLESFMMSDIYSGIRYRHMTAHKVPVPQHLKEQH